MYTSARTQGQVDFGFSVQLQQWEEMQQQNIAFLVPEADHWVFRFTLQRQVRHVWQQQSFTLSQFVAHSLSLSPYEFYDRMRQTSYFGEFWQWLTALPEVENLTAQRFASVPITTAIAHLRQYVQRIKPFVPIDPSGTALYVDGRGALVDGRPAPNHEKHRAPRPPLVGS